MSRPPTAPQAIDAATAGDEIVRDRMPLADQVVDALRIYAADNAEVMNHLAEWLGVGTNDAEAFGQVLYNQDRGMPLSPTVLGRRIGLSSGATTALLNRLEARGLVVRSREHRDRRVVTLRIPPDVEERATRFFAPLGDRVDAMTQQHPPELIRQLVTVLDDLHVAITEVLDGFRTSALAGHDRRPGAAAGADEPAEVVQHDGGPAADSTGRSD